MKNIKNYQAHLRESEAAPQTRRSIDDLWIVYFQEEDDWHFIAAYEDPSSATERFTEEADDWHGDAIEERIQQMMDDDPDVWGEGSTPAELCNRDPNAYHELWFDALDFVQAHEEGEGREYSYARLKHIESDMESAGRADDLKRFMKDLTSSDETPGWAKSAIERRERSRGAFGRF